MTSTLRLMLLFCCALPMAAQDVGSSGPVPLQDIDAKALVVQLGSSEFATRDGAMTQLKALGAKAREALAEGTKSTNLECSTRCSMLLKELDGGGKVEVPLREVLPERGRSDRGGGGNVVSGSVTQSVYQNREQRVEVMQRGDGFTRVTIQKLNGRGKAVGDQECYEAPNATEFEKKFPEVYAAHVRQKTSLMPNVPPVVDGPRLGVTLETASDDLCIHLDLPFGTQRISAVVPGSCAEKIGIQQHDLLLLVDDTKILTAEDIRTTLRREAPTTFTVTIMRKGARMTLSGPRPR